MENHITLFISHAHSDKDLLDDLANHLAVLERKGLVCLWSRNDIVPGTERDVAIQDHLSVADLILLLVSSDFLASDDCIQEVEHTMKRQRAGETYVLPILLRPAEWQVAPFGTLQALPSNGKPVTLWQNQDEAFSDIVKGIRAVIRRLIPFPQLDTSLLEILNAQMEECRRKNMAVYTPHLLLALLQTSLTKQALEYWRPGLASTLQEKLKEYVSHILPKYPQPFYDFLWEERKDVQKARQIAREDDSDTIQEKHLLLGILETEGNTQQALKRFLGEKSFHQLIPFLRSFPLGTPGIDDVF